MQKPSLDYITTHSKSKLDGDMKNVKSPTITSIERAHDVSVQWGVECSGVQCSAVY